MSLLVVYARIYAGCFNRTLRAIAKNAWTLILPVAISIAFIFAQGLLVTALGGTIAGFILGFVLAAAFSCYLYFLAGVVAHSLVRAKEMGTALKAYFWSVINVMFVFWIATLLSDLVLNDLPQGGVLKQLMWLAVAILCNAAPEFIYLRGTYGGLETLHRSLNFFQENWIEWGIPNVLLLGALVKLQSAELWGIHIWLRALLFGAVLHLVMVYRGHLFEVLVGTSHRQRMFRYRNGL